MQRFSFTNFSIELPDDWCYKKEKYCYTFFNNDMSGALQISVYTKTDSITDEDILDFIDDIKKDFLAKKKYGDFEGFICCYSEDKTFWKQLWLINDRVFLFITYNEKMHKSIKSEMKIINSILSSLQVVKNIRKCEKQ